MLSLFCSCWECFASSYQAPHTYFYLHCYTIDRSITHSLLCTACEDLSYDKIFDLTAGPGPGWAYPSFFYNTLLLVDAVNVPGTGCQAKPYIWWMTAFSSPWSRDSSQPYTDRMNQVGNSREVWSHYKYDMQSPPVVCDARNTIRHICTTRTGIECTAVVPTQLSSSTCVSTVPQGTSSHPPVCGIMCRAFNKKQIWEAKNRTKYFKTEKYPYVRCCCCFLTLTLVKNLESVVTQRCWSPRKIRKTKWNQNSSEKYYALPPKNARYRKRRTNEKVKCANWTHMAAGIHSTTA